MDTLQLPSPPPSSANSVSGSTSGNSLRGSTGAAGSGPGSAASAGSTGGMKPLCINIPTPHGAGTDTNYHSSPPNSPTGTIRFVEAEIKFFFMFSKTSYFPFSVPNSCPTSPSGRIHHHPYMSSALRGHPDHRARLHHGGTSSVAVGSHNSSSGSHGNSSAELEDQKPDLSHLGHNPVVYPSEDGQHLSTIPGTKFYLVVKIPIRACCLNLLLF